MPRRATAGSFKPGHCPNPGGKRKHPPTISTREFREAAKAHYPEAIETVLRCMREGDKAADRLAAARVMLEYGFGRPGAMEPEQASSGLSGADVIRLLSVVPNPAELPPTEHDQSSSQDEAATPEASGTGQDVAAAV